MNSLAASQHSHHSYWGTYRTSATTFVCLCHSSLPPSAKSGATGQSYEIVKHRFCKTSPHTFLQFCCLQRRSVTTIFVVHNGSAFGELPAPSSDYTLIMSGPPLWSRGNIVTSHAAVPGSLCGWVIFLLEVFSLNCMTVRKFGPLSSPVIMVITYHANHIHPSTDGVGLRP